MDLMLLPSKGLFCNSVVGQYITGGRQKNGTARAARVFRIRNTDRPPVKFCVLENPAQKFPGGGLETRKKKLT